MGTKFLDKIAKIRELEDEMAEFAQTIEGFNETLQEEQIGNPVWLVEVEDMARQVHIEIHKLFGELVISEAKDEGAEQSASSDQVTCACKAGGAS